MKSQRTASKFAVHLIDLAPFAELINATYKKYYPDVDMTKDGFTTMTTRGVQGMVETKKGWVNVCDEGVIDENPVSGAHPLELELFTSSATGFSMFPWTVMKFSVDELQKLISNKTVPLHEFIRTFGSRLEQNYWICEDHLTKLNKKSRKVKVAA
jgi:hypothetical protein